MVRSKLIAVAIFAAALSGCASNSDIRRLDGDLARVRMDAQEARDDAAEARRVADEANSRAKTTEEMLNRGFKRSMYK